MAELACYMTMCGLENAHKYHVLKSAMNITYKIGNNMTAAHFARAIIDLESTGVSDLFCYLVTNLYFSL
jgi:hypothetical protein